MDISLSTFTPENLISRDGFGRLVARGWNIAILDEVLKEDLTPQEAEWITMNVLFPNRIVLRCLKLPRFWGKSQQNILLGMERNLTRRGRQVLNLHYLIVLQ